MENISFIPDGIKEQIINLKGIPTPITDYGNTYMWIILGFVILAVSCYFMYYKEATHEQKQENNTIISKGMIKEYIKKITEDAQDRQNDIILHTPVSDDDDTSPTVQHEKKYDNQYSKHTAYDDDDDDDYNFGGQYQSRMAPIPVRDHY